MAQGSRRIARGAGAPPWRYRWLARLLSPLMVAHALWRSRRDGGQRYWQQRTGHHYPALHRPRWIHAASVGEVITVLPVVQALLTHEDDDILVTTTTPTGAEVLARRLGTRASGGTAVRVHHAYLPIDTPAATARFLAATTPVSAWIVETEIWPWLYANCHAADIPITIVNGRLSEKTRRAARGVLGAAYARALARVRVLARSEDDARAFVALGAPAEAVLSVGNLKLADAASSNGPIQLPATATARPIAQQYCLAASTHADEEVQLVQQWLAQREAGLLVVVPRHPERGPGIAQAIEQLLASHSQASGGQSIATAATVPLRSRDQPVELSTRVYIADTLGELDTWYAHADAVFVGGSLIAHGGHNLLEPARHGCAIVTGPHMHNFADVLQLLDRENAVLTVTHAADAVAALTRLQASTEQRQALSAGCQRALARGRHVLAAYLDELAIGGSAG